MLIGFCWSSLVVVLGCRNEADSEEPFTVKFTITELVNLSLLVIVVLDPFYSEIEFLSTQKLGSFLL